MSFFYFYDEYIVLSSFAQEESKNISDNIKWRIRKDFQKGKIMINTTRFLGYDKDKEGNLVINEKEAKIVRRIFNLYIGGTGCIEIARILTKEGHKTVTGKDRWDNGVVSNMLKNEKYKGDVLCQKTYTPNHLARKSIDNKGELDQYYIKDHHVPIVSRDVWDRAQAVREENKYIRGITNDPKYNNKYPYTGNIFCSKCGATLRRRVWNSKLPCRKIVWLCSNYIEKGVDYCSGTRVDEKELDRAKVKGKTIVEEEIRDGKKYYTYSRKGEQNELSGSLESKKKRMAAYCRVLTDQAEQLSSYEVQVSYYTTFITGHPDYDFAGIY